MTVEERIRRCLLLEEIKKNKTAAQKNGLEDVSALLQCKEKRE